MYDVAIIGGGLAGSVCGIALARAGIATVIIERDTAPKHKLCGEFLSGEVASLFNSIEILDDIIDAGAIALKSSRIHALSGKTIDVELPGHPLGISRLALDNMLRQIASREGVNIIESNATDITRENSAFRVATDQSPVDARIVIGAYGRRSTLDRKLERPFIRKTYPYVAFKTHVRNVNTEDRVELFALDGGYCGMSRVEEGLTNVCWITRKENLVSVGGSPRTFWSEVLPTNHVLRDYLSGRSPEHEFSSSSQLFFTAKAPVVNNVLMIGDAAGMIAPLAGDGMAMAIDSAIHVSRLVKYFLSGELSMQGLGRRYTAERRRRYATRMTVARMLHQMLAHPRASNLGVSAALLVPGLARVLVNLTRGRVRE